MLTIEDLRQTLLSLGFQATGRCCSKSIGAAKLQVRLGKQEIVHPESLGLLINTRSPAEPTAP